jgi:hypothetical protein
MYKIIGADLKEYGPVSAEQLRQWIAEGRVNGQTKVQAADATEWKTMADLPEFAGVLPASPLPAHPIAPVEPSVELGATSAPMTPLPLTPRNSQMAVWAMVSGIGSLLCCCGFWLLAPLAIVLGAVALSQSKDHPELTGRGFAITGIVLGIVAILSWAVFWLVCFSSPDFMQSMRNAMQQQ